MWLDVLVKTRQLVLFDQVAVKGPAGLSWLNADKELTKRYFLSASRAFHMPATIQGVNR